jgi:hypothetical protein
MLSNLEIIKRDIPLFQQKCLSQFGYTSNCWLTYLRWLADCNRAHTFQPNEVKLARSLFDSLENRTTRVKVILEKSAVVSSIELLTPYTLTHEETLEVIREAFYSWDMDCDYEKHLEYSNIQVLCYCDSEDSISYKALERVHALEIKLS